MNAKMWPLLIVLPLLAVATRAQESVRDLDGSGCDLKWGLHS